MLRLFLFKLNHVSPDFCDRLLLLLASDAGFNLAVSKFSRLSDNYELIEKLIPHQYGQFLVLLESHIKLLNDEWTKITPKETSKPQNVSQDSDEKKNLKRNIGDHSSSSSRSTNKTSSNTKTYDNSRFEYKGPHPCYKCGKVKYTAEHYTSCNGKLLGKKSTDSKVNVTVGSISSTQPIIDHNYYSPM
jgi:hypothetical protein